MIKLLTVATGLGFAVAAGAAQETVAPNFPRVSINNGAETAMLLDAVYLTIGYQDGRPTEYRVSEGVGFLEAFAVWRPVPANASATSFRVIHPAPNGRFAAPAAFKQVFIQLRNAGGTSRTNLDSINVHQEYDIEPGLALDEARSTGFAFSSTPSGCVQRRSVQDSRQVILFGPSSATATPAACQHVVFAGRKLKAPWSFRSREVSAPAGCIATWIAPTPGTSVLESRLDQRPLAPNCTAMWTRLRLVGPVGARWQDAFSQ